VTEQPVHGASRSGWRCEGGVARGLSVASQCTSGLCMLIHHEPPSKVISEYMHSLAGKGGEAKVRRKLAVLSITERLHRPLGEAKETRVREPSLERPGGGLSNPGVLVNDGMLFDVSRSIQPVGGRPCIAECASELKMCSIMLAGGRKSGGDPGDFQISKPRYPRLYRLRRALP